MFSISKPFLHKQIQTYYQHIIFNVKGKNGQNQTSSGKNKHIWDAKVFVKTLQP
jgi:hypothetical protein